jgi:hypothetical protein
MVNTKRKSRSSTVISMDKCKSIVQTIRKYFKHYNSDASIFITHNRLVERPIERRQLYFGGKIRKYLEMKEKRIFYVKL